MGHHTQAGVVGCLSIEEYRDGTILRHELTRPEKEDDRTQHILATGAQTGPIFVAHRADPAIDETVKGITGTPPAYDFEASDGVRHRFWIAGAGETVRRLAGLFRPLPRLYIADGHHRSAAAARAAAECRRRNPRHSGSEDYNFFLAVVFPHTQLQILEYNRLVRTLNGLRRDRFLNLLHDSFTVDRTPGRVRPMRKGEFGLYLDGSWYTMACREKLLEEQDPVRRLDVSVLQNHVLGPLLGVDDPRTSSRIDFVGGIRGPGELERRVNSGEMAAAFTLYPTSMDELMEIADAGLFMPPKSTWFEPKLRDGLVIHSISDA